MHVLKRRLLSGSAWAFVGKVTIAFSGLVSNVLLARLLTPQDLGAYFLASSIVTVGALLGSLGLTGTIVRFVAEGMGLNHLGRVRRTVGVVLGAGTLGALGAGLAYLLFGDGLVKIVFDAPALAAIGGLVAGWIVVTTLQGLLAETFRGFHDVRLATLLGGQLSMGSATGVATMALFAISLGALWLVEGRATLTTIVLLAICSGSVITLLSGWLLHRKVVGLRPKPSDEGQRPNLKEEVGQAFSVAWPLLIVGLVGFARNYGDIWVVGAFRSQEEIAVYGAALRLVAMVSMPLIIINAVAPPLIAEMYAQGKREELEHTLRGLATLTGIPALLASMGCIFFASSILGLVYGDYYSQGAMVLALLSVGLLVSVLTGSCGLALIYTGHQKSMMMITTATAALTLVGMIVVVKPYGITGVAVVSLASLLLQNSLMLLMVKRKTGMWTHIGFRRVPELLRIAG